MSISFDDCLDSGYVAQDGGTVLVLSPISVLALQDAFGECAGASVMRILTAVRALPTLFEISLPLDWPADLTVYPRLAGNRVDAVLVYVENEDELDDLDSIDDILEEVDAYFTDLLCDDCLQVETDQVEKVTVRAETKDLGGKDKAGDVAAAVAHPFIKLVD